jgi:hypothetical protein
MSQFTEMNNSNSSHVVPFKEIFVTFDQQDASSDIAATFGKLQLCVNKHERTIDKQYDIEFYMDNSSSMHDPCRDGTTKMEHTKRTAERLIRHLCERGIKATISVSSFDNKINRLVTKEELTVDSIQCIATKIRSIVPYDMTNIEAVLTEASQTVRSQDKEHIFFMFTDGEATFGKTKDRYELIDISKNIVGATKVTIGCGTEHDSELLNGISCGVNDIYKFVGKIEESGMACGEILDKILNVVLKSVTVSLQDGEIYDWRDNKWKDHIFTENIISECDKFYHVRSRTPDTFRAYIRGTEFDTGDQYYVHSDELITRQDLSAYKFRQETLEALFEVNDYNGTHNKYAYNPNRTTERTLRRRLSDLLWRMEQYMTERSLSRDIFMRMLCDDVVVCLRTLGTDNSLMYTRSRQHTQGTQGIYNNTIDYSEAQMQSPHAHSYFVNYDVEELDEEDELDNGLDNEGANDACCGIGLSKNSSSSSCDSDATYVPNHMELTQNYKTMGSDDSPYATQRTLRLMKHISS